MKHYIKATQSNEQDSLGNPLTPEQSSYFKDSKVRDEQGRLLVCYHGTKNAGFEEFLPQDFTDTLYYKFGKSNVNFFTTVKQNAMGYADYMFKRQPDGTWGEPDPYDFIPNEHGKKSGIYAVYLNIKNPLIIDPDDSLYDKESSYDNRYWKNIKRDGAPKRARIKQFFDKYNEYKYDFISDVFDWEPDFEKDLKRIGISVTPDDDEYEFKVLSNNNDMWSDPSGSSLITTDNMEDLMDELEYNFEDYQTDDYYTKESTNDIIIDTLLDHPEYDGIIFKNIIDAAGILGSTSQTTIVTLKGSNQIKSINNKKPTSSGNINASNTLRRNKMKRYIRSAQRTVLGPIERLKSELGISDWYGNAKLYSSSDSKWDYCISSNYGSLSQDDIEKFTSRLKKIGAKRISKRYGRIYFCYNMSKLQSDYETELQQAKDDYTAELNAIDIDKYKPDNAIINKLIAYRDKGSMVNVKAIKDVNKVIKYYYAACIIDWDELSGACWDKLCGLGSSIPYKTREQYKDLLTAISRRVEQNPDYKDKRSEMDQRNGNKNSGNLFTFEDKNCWLPKSILNYFVDNNIPVHFGKRTSGSHYDSNGRQWSEIEHLTLFPDSDNPINYDIVVHTDEGDGPTTYTGKGTDERVSAKKVIEDIADRVQYRNS